MVNLFFFLLLQSFLESIKGVNGYFIDGNAHFLKRNQSIGFNGVHEDDRREDQQNGDKATPGNIDDRGSLRQAAAVEYYGVVVSHCFNHFWTGEVFQRREVVQITHNIARIVEGTGGQGEF